MRVPLNIIALCYNHMRYHYKGCVRQILVVQWLVIYLCHINLRKLVSLVMETETVNSAERVEGANRLGLGEACAKICCTNCICECGEKLNGNLHLVDWQNGRKRITGEKGKLAKLGVVCI